MRWIGPEQRPKSSHMKDAVFALLPLNGQREGKEEEEDGAGEEVNIKSEGGGGGGVRNRCKTLEGKKRSFSKQ